MVKPVSKRATYEDVLRAPPNKVAEIVDGELHLSPRPGGPHTQAASTLGEELGPPFKRGRGGPGGWIILDEPELHLGPDVLVPDLAGWRIERMPEIATEPAYFTVVPDWACEVLSRSTARLDRAKKLPIYARERVRHVWLIDPIERTLEAYRLEAERWVLLGTWTDDARIRVEPFDAIELELGVLWDRVQLPPDQR